MADEKRTRGYTIRQAGSFLRSVRGVATADDPMLSASPETRRIVESGRTTDWYPVASLIELFGLIAKLGQGDEPKTRNLLIECGRYSAKEATGTFLRLMMRVLSPDLFARKMPILWGRDFNFGKVEVQLGPRRIMFRVEGIGGLDHFSPVMVGFTTLLLTAMGKHVSLGSLPQWSLKEPGPEAVDFELKW